MSLLTLVQNVLETLSLPSASSVISSTDLTTKQVRRLAELSGEEILRMYPWPQLQKEHTFSLVASTASYALPADFQRFISRTMWDRTNYWELRGGVTAQEWQWRKSGIVNSLPRFNFRIKGNTLTQFFVDPTPGTGDTNSLVFEYQSVNWARPRTWVQGQSYISGDYTFYNGNYYTASTSGTTGATPPTHTSGSSSDGGVTWAYYSGAYKTFTADTDETVLPQHIHELDTKWRFMQSKGMDYLDYKMQAMDAIRREATAHVASPSLTLSGRSFPLFISPANIPDSGFGS